VLSDANKEILDLRFQAFVVEKNVPKNIEFDGKDAQHMHFCLYDDSALIGCARGNIDSDVIHIGRVTVKNNLRGKGYGKKLFTFIEDYARRNNCVYMELGAIETAVEFYKKIGFITVGEYYMEAGWPHISMKKVL